MGTIKWSKDECFKLAKTCKSRSEYKRMSQSAYNSSRKNGWLSDYYWFDDLKKPNGYWNYETCLEEARNIKRYQHFVRQAHIIQPKQKVGYLNMHGCSKKRLIIICVMKKRKHTQR